MTTVWQQAFRKPLRVVWNSDFIGLYGHVGFGWHILVGRDR